MAAASPETRAPETAQPVCPDTEVLFWSPATVQGERPYNSWAAGRQPAHIQLRATRAKCSGGASLTPGMLSWSMAQATVLLNAHSGADMFPQARLLPGESSRHPAAPPGILHRSASLAHRFLSTLEVRGKPVPAGGTAISRGCSATGACGASGARCYPLDTLGFEPRAFRMRSGCDATTPCAPYGPSGPRIWARVKQNTE